MRPIHLVNINNRGMVEFWRGTPDDSTPMSVNQYSSISLASRNRFLRVVNELAENNCGWWYVGILGRGGSDIPTGGNFMAGRFTFWKEDDV